MSRKSPFLSLAIVIKTIRVNINIDDKSYNDLKQKRNSEQTVLHNRINPFITEKTKLAFRPNCTDKSKNGGTGDSSHEVIDDINDRAVTIKRTTKNVGRTGSRRAANIKEVVIELTKVYTFVRADPMLSLL